MGGVLMTKMRSRAFWMPGRPSTAPRTIHAPVAPEATWMAVLPWMCGWYQSSPSWWTPSSSTSQRYWAPAPAGRRLMTSSEKKHSRGPLSGSALQARQARPSFSTQPPPAA